MKNANSKTLFTAFLTFILLAGAVSASSLTLYSGWNMITPSDDGLTASAISSACSQAGSIWHYDGTNYQRASGTLEAGKGYWVRVNSQCTINTNGNAYSVSSLSLNSGWNQIGIPSSTGAYSSTSTCSIQGGPWYYDTSSNSYQRSDLSSLIAGKGYWIKTSSSCTLSFSDSPPLPPADENSSLSYISAYSSRSSMTRGETATITVYAYDADGTYATTQEGTGVSATVSGGQYTLSSFTFDGSKYSATFIPAGTGTYTISASATKGGVQKSGSASISVNAPGQQNGEPLGKIAYWYGKVNQHQGIGGSWETDSDGVSGADISQLAYCQKFFPGTLGVNETGRTYIGNWKNRGNTDQFGEYGVEYLCLPFSYYRVITDLHPPASEVGTATFTSTPSGAYVVVKQDDRSMAYGTTPYTVRLQYGSYTATYTKDGYSAHTGQISVNSRTQTFNATLQAQQQALGQVAYWYGKYNQFRAVGGNWQGDASAGANVDQLAYCKQKFAGALGVNEVSSSYMSNWKDANGKTYNGYGIIYDCLSYAYRSTPTSLRPQTQGTAMHLYDELATQRFRVRLYDIGANSAAFDILDSNGNILRQSVVVSTGSNYTYSQQGTNYGVNIKVYSTDSASGKSAGYRWADVSASDVTVQNLAPVGYIAYWYGKVNMHSSDGSSWQTDADGRSGANTNQLDYCKKYFPSSLGYNETGQAYIYGWKDANGNSYNGYGVKYACLPFAYERKVTDLTPDVALDYVAISLQQGTITTGGSTQVYLYAYETDGSQATPSEGAIASVRVSVNAKQGYSLTSLTFSNNRYVATFSATQAGDYVIYGTVSKGDKNGTASTTVRVSPITLGQIAQWSGKVNLHRDPNGQWATDPDGSSGANIAPLTYCQKFFPQSTSATSAGSMYISGWRNYGNSGSFNGTGTAYNCIQG